jgi:hypothetical protein
MKPWEVVKRMSAARERGHGCVSEYLGAVGVPRSTAYRWEQELAWLIEHGPSELRRLRRECEALTARVARAAAGQAAGPGLSAERERAFLLHAVVLGASDTEAALLLERAGGRSLSHQRVHEIVAEAERVARETFRRYFQGVGRVGAADELFQGRQPILLVVEPRSLLVFGLHLAEGRGAEDWKPLLAAMTEMERCASDAARGLTKAADERGFSRQFDMRHGLTKGRAWLARSAAKCEKKLDDEQGARQALDEFRGSGNHGRIAAAERRAKRLGKAADEALREWCRLDDLFGQVERAFDYTTAEGKLNTAERASGLVAEALRAMGETEEGRGLAKTLRLIEWQPAFAFLAVLAMRLRAYGPDQVGPDREARLARLVTETLAWRRHDKDPVSLLRAASTGSPADELEIGVVEAVDDAVRSSSSVECVNSRVRLVQVARKRLSEGFLYLLAVYHNMRTFGRGSAREGKSAAELAGIELPTNDWIELLDLTEKAMAQTKANAA